MSAGRGAVIGVDGSAGSLAALDWAIARADRLGVLRPVSTWRYPLTAWLPAPLSAGAMPPEEAMQAAAEEAATAYDVLLASVESEPPHVQRGAASEVLLEQAADARMLVVGTRGHGAVADMLLGSVGRRCADQAKIPLVIVPHGTAAELPSSERIVVGVDGSQSSEAALGWAIGFARPSDEIVAVTAWVATVPGGSGAGGIDPAGFDQAGFDPSVLEALPRQTLSDAVAAACEATGCDPQRIETRLVEGDPRGVLNDLADEADLLVLGRRGHSGLAHLLLGSTTTSLIHSPRCPIAVIA